MARPCLLYSHCCCREQHNCTFLLTNWNARPNLFSLSKDLSSPSLRPPLYYLSCPISQLKLFSKMMMPHDEDDQHHNHHHHHSSLTKILFFVIKIWLSWQGKNWPVLMHRVYLFSIWTTLRTDRRVWKLFAREARAQFFYPPPLSNLES